MLHLPIVLFLLAAPPREVALTFDDLPNLTADEDSVATTTAIMNEIISRLAEAQVPAIGFVNESKLGDDPRLVKLLDSWLSAGLDLGNHTFSHEPLSSTPIEEYEDDILDGERITRTLTLQHGRPYGWFRFPYLDEGKSADDREAIERFLADHGYRVAPVTIDNYEWIYAMAWRRTRSPFTHWRLARAYLRGMEERFSWTEARSRSPQIVLVHADALNAAVLPQLLRMIRERGYRFVSIDEAMRGPFEEIDENNDPTVPQWVQRLAGVIAP